MASILLANERINDNNNTKYIFRMYRIIHWMHFIVTNYMDKSILNLILYIFISELQISETKYYRKNDGKKYVLFNKYRITYKDTFCSMKFCKRLVDLSFSIFMFYFNIILYKHRVILGNTEHAFMQRASMHAFAKHFTHLRLFRTTPLASTSSQHCYVETFNINFHYTSFIKKL